MPNLSQPTGPRKERALLWLLSGLIAKAERIGKRWQGYA